MKIYTKKGDAGETSLYTGKRVPKNHPIIEILGEVDELNCYLGLTLTALPKTDEMQTTVNQLLTIQRTLFDLGAILAGRENDVSFIVEFTSLLEKWIDEMDETLPPLQQFILPGGCEAGALLHVSRAICRRTERSISPASVKPPLLAYFNRLSDYLFVLARHVNHLARSPEILWKSISK